MVNEQLKGYRPNWVAPPGNTIKENLAVIGMTQSELAKRMGMAKENVNEILNGKSAITSETALKFESVLGMSADFILRLESSYRIYLAENERKEKEQKEIGILKEIPYKQMMNNGWIPFAKDKLEIVQNLKQYLGVDTFANLKNVYAFYRRSPTVTSNEYAIIAWLRKGELDSQAIELKSYDKNRLKTMIPEIRSLNTCDFNVIRKKLSMILEACGVSLSYVPCLKHTPVYGAVKWLTSDKPLIMMSLRYKTDDHFWFTLMHEIYHVLYPQKTSIIVEEKNSHDEYERKADRFAAKILISDSMYNEFVRNNDFSIVSIVEFAEKVGVVPGIVLGRLQHDNFIPFELHNNLKRKYEMD